MRLHACVDCLILVSRSQDVFPTETDSYFDLYTRELYSYPLQNEMHSKLCCKAMMTTVDYHSPPSHTTSTLQHCSFRPSDMERFTVTGEWNTLGTILQDDDGNSLQRSLHTQGTHLLFSSICSHSFVSTNCFALREALYACPYRRLLLV